MIKRNLTVTQTQKIRVAIMVLAPPWVIASAMQATRANNAMNKSFHALLRLTAMEAI